MEENTHIEELEAQISRLENQIDDQAQLISDLRVFAPDVVGRCPKCGHYVFEGYRCFGCGADYSDSEKPLGC